MFAFFLSVISVCDTWGAEGGIQQGCLEVQQLVEQLSAQGINPTLKNIRQFMAKPSALWKKEVVQAFWEARRSLDNA